MINNLTALENGLVETKQEQEAIKSCVAVVVAVWYNALFSQLCVYYGKKGKPRSTNINETRKQVLEVGCLTYKKKSDIEKRGIVTVNVCEYTGLNP